MNAVDASDHVEIEASEASPSLCTLILDTNPRAWAAIGSVLPLSKVVSNILVYLNANLAFSNANQVAVIAAHSNRAQWLYPPHPKPATFSGRSAKSDQNGDKSESKDVDMTDAPAAPAEDTTSANKYPQFARIETAVLNSVKKLIEETSADDLESTTPQLAGALTLALAYINKTSQAYSASKVDPNKPAEAAAAATASSTSAQGISASVLILSVSDSDPAQYIPTMNAVFAAAHNSIPIDVLYLSPSTICSNPKTRDGADPNNNNHNNNGDKQQQPQPDTNSFLQQASHITNGVYLAPPHPHGILTYLLFAHAFADTSARAALVPPTHHTVDFRAACFCHGRVVDTGFVCSVCLSIFCSVPENADCLTCGTHLALGNYGAKPAVVPRKKLKKKKKKILPNGSVREETGSATGTPMR